MAEMTIRHHMILDMIETCDGAEVAKDSWSVVEDLVSAGVVRWTSGPRGPNQEWRRAELVPRRAGADPQQLQSK